MEDNNVTEIWVGNQMFIVKWEDVDLVEIYDEKTQFIADIASTDMRGFMSLEDAADQAWDYMHERIYEWEEDLYDYGYDVEEEF